MPVRFVCPGCQTTSQVADQHVGKTVACPHCGKPVHVAAPPILTALPADDPFEGLTATPPAPSKRPERQSGNPRFRPRKARGNPVAWIVAGILAGVLLLCAVPSLLVALWLVLPSRPPIADPGPDLAQGPDGEAPARGDALIPAPVRFKRVPDAPKPVAWKVPELKEDPLTIKLPAPVANLAVGGGGRFLVLHLPSQKKLAVFDVTELRIVHEIPTADDVRFTAGMDRLVILTGERLERWNLLTGKKEGDGPAPGGGRIAGFAMGYASAGPILVGVQPPAPPGRPFEVPAARWTFLDLETLQPPEEDGTEPGPFRVKFADSIDAVSADGEAFCVVSRGGDRDETRWTLLLLGRELRVLQNKRDFGYEKTGGPDALCFTGRPVYDNQVNLRRALSYLPRGAQNPVTDWYVPALDGICTILYRQTGEAATTKRSISVRLPGVEEPLQTWDAVEDLADPMEALWANEQMPRLRGARRIHLIPAARLLITLPRTNDRLILRRFDPDAATAQAKLDRPVVISQPPVSVARGEAVQYQIDARAKGVVKGYRLEYGPKGMAVSPTGLLTWTVPADLPVAETGVVVSITDAAGKETFHRFWLLHPGGAPDPEGIATRHEASPPVPPRPPVPAPKLEARRVEVKVDPFVDLVPGGGGRYLVLHQLASRRLAVFDVSQLELVHTIPLRDTDVRFAAGLERVVVVYPKEGLIERWGLTGGGREQVALLPPGWRGVRAIALGHASAGPVLVHWVENFGELDRAGQAFLDLQTLKLLPTRWEGMPHYATYREVVQLRASADGQAFGMWCTNHSPHGLQTLVRGPQSALFHYEHEDPSHIIPGPDGKMIFTSMGMCTADLKPGERWRPRVNGPLYLPAAQGPYYMQIDPAPGFLQPAKGSTVTICKLGNAKPLLRLPDLDASLGGEGMHRDTGRYDTHLHLVPEAGVLVAVPYSHDRLVFHRVDIKE